MLMCYSCGAGFFTPEGLEAHPCIGFIPGPDGSRPEDPGRIIFNKFKGPEADGFLIIDEGPYDFIKAHKARLQKWREEQNKEPILFYLWGPK